MLELPDDRGFVAEPEEGRLVRDRGGEDARVAMAARLRDPGPPAPVHTPTDGTASGPLDPRPGYRRTMSTRRMFLCGTAAVVGAAFTGCRTAPAPEAAFTTFVVGEFGGVDGRRNLVEVAPDGVALVTGRTVAAGRLADDLMDRARRLLVSVDFRREVAESADRDDTPARCSDQVTWSVAMGELRSTIPDRCGSGPGTDRKVTAEVITLVRDAIAGRFAAPLGPGAPDLLACRLAVRTDQDYRIRLEPTGRLILDRSGRQTTHQLEATDRDALRLLLPRLISRPGSCRAEAPFQLTITDTAVCAAGDRDGFNAVVRVLIDAVGL